MIHSILDHCHSWILKIRYFKNNQLSYGSKLIGNSVLMGRNHLARNVVLIDSLLGYATYVARDTDLIKTKVGSFSCIGPNVHIVAGRHPTSKFASIHPAFFSLRKQSGFTYVTHQLFDEFAYVGNDTRYFVEIGNDVWIGDSAMIMSGVTIGDGAIIGAGALVTKDVEAYSIVGGVPAKVIKMRFDEKTTDLLKKIKWWEHDEVWIREHARYFFDHDILIKKISDEGYDL